MTLSLNEAKRILDPILPKLSKSINAAINDYKRNILRLEYSRRTRASIINDLMWRYAQEALIDAPGIFWRRKGNSHYLIIEDKFKLKFKMLTKNLRSMNIPTQQALDFVYQENGQLDFPDKPAPVTNILAGYKWNDLQTDHDGVYIVCPFGTQNLWALEITQEKSKEAEIVPIPTTERKRVAVRKVEEDVKNKESK
ncbi:MAG: hypothetical protein JL50_02865 [Peptococcaceae bacterium BICA1-7]|nr:MAG: hypothetical protein JL50_02865 [Peptococcaceae bacterium BICA1-7]HBV97794.1 hypothetical protein [Desulfotomaculum sp.]